MSRAPLDAHGGRPTTAHDLQLALGIVNQSGIVKALEPDFVAEVGRHRVIKLKDSWWPANSTPWAAITGDI